MSHPRHWVRALSAALLSLALTTTLTPGSHADPASPDDQPFQRVHRSATRAPGTATSGNTFAPAASETGNAVSLINSFRGRVGLAAVGYDSALDSALRAHANYLQLNIGRADLDPYTEVAGYPGYTAAGADIAPWVGVTFQSPNYGEAVQLLVMDPWERSARFLHPDATGFAITRTADFTVMAFNFGDNPTSPALTFPQGSNHSRYAFDSSAYSYYTGNCSQQSTAWGYPVTAQFDYREFDSIKSVSTSLFRDGSPISYCLLWQTAHTGIEAQAVLIPTSPLVQGSHYTGKVNATGVRPNGTTAALSLTIDFTTWAPVSGVPGDQTGDRVADVLGVDGTGTLRVYKGSTPGTLGYGWRVGGGWGSFTWVAHTPDTNGDGREDLLGRRSDGKLFLLFGQGMGAYSSARQVGTGWGGLRNLTVVGDMSGTGQTHVVGISPEGNLHRYNLTSTGMAGAAKIGTGWGGMEHLASVGSFNSNDSTADIIAVGSNGNLYSYFTREGQIVQAALVGRGWSGWTAFFSPGDLSGDGRPDLLGRNVSGEMYSYTNQVGSWGAARKAGQGWGGFTLFG